MYILILILPLLGSLFSGLSGRFIGIKGSEIITCSCLIISSLLMTNAFYEVCLSSSPVYINLGYWLNSELLSISWELKFDQLTVSLGIAVLYCSSLIHIYSISYLSSDPTYYFGKILLWEKFSNSGKILKFIIPNYFLKY